MNTMQIYIDILNLKLIYNDINTKTYFFSYWIFTFFELVFTILNKFTSFIQLKMLGKVFKTIC